MANFKDLGLSDELLKALAEIGFEKPTEIQEKAIPMSIEGDHDLIGQAQTGTGKTAAFGLPLLDRIDEENKEVQGLVLAPTRELGQQIAQQLLMFGQYLRKVKILPVYGGASISHQIKALRKGQHIIVATPGRLVDLLKRKALTLDKLRFLVLDEADEMLNMGFKEELDQILDSTPKDKITWLYAATMPREIRRIIKKYMDDPFEITVSKQNVVNTNIEHQFVVVKQSNRTEALTRFLDLDPNMRGVVFCRTKRDTQALAEDLMARGYKADAIHGDLNQPQRDRVMKRFKAHDLHVLVATDVAARGIDVNNLTHVFHFALPDDNAYYTHRSGRTARAGKKGVSIAFVSSREKGKINRLERELSIKFEKKEVASADEIIIMRIEEWCRNILNTKTKDKLDYKLLTNASLIFDDISKDELLAKLLMNEVEKINQLSNKNLNESPQEEQRRPRSRSSSSYKKKEYRGKRSSKKDYNFSSKNKGKRKARAK